MRRGAAGDQLAFVHAYGLLPLQRDERGAPLLALQVYESAALAFSSLQRVVGAQAVHAIIPSMLSLLRSSDTADAEAALRGLRETVTQRPAAVVPFLIPRLVASPISTAAARALSVVASACGPSLYPLLDETLPSLLDAIYLEVELLPAEKIGEYDPEVGAKTHAHSRLNQSKCPCDAHCPCADKASPKCLAGRPSHYVAQRPALPVRCRSHTLYCRSLRE